MDEAYAYTYAPNGDLFLPFLLVLRGADSEDDLSKYVFVSRQGTIQYPQQQTCDKGNEKKSNNCKELRFSLAYLHILLNLCMKRYQKRPNSHKEDIVEYAKCQLPDNSIDFFEHRRFCAHSTIVLIPQTANRYDKHTIFLSLIGKIASSCKHHEERGLLHLCRVNLIGKSFQCRCTIIDEFIATKFNFY